MTSTEEYRYKLSKNDEDIIKNYNVDKKGNPLPLSENARKTLIILSEVFGGLHHLEGDQLELFDYQSTFYNQYLIHGSLATFDGMELTCLVIIAHDMAVRFEIQSTILNKEDQWERKLLQKQLDDINGENDWHLTLDDIDNDSNFRQIPYIKLLFHQRTREGDYSNRHPSLEESIEGFRKGNKRFA